MSEIVIVYHSGYGHTKKVAEAVAAGASAKLVAISDAGELTEADWEVLSAAKTIVFGAPTYMGNSSWQFKKFADATSKVWFVRGWQDKLFAGFTNSASPNGDKALTMESFQVLASQHGGIWISLGAAPSNTKAATTADTNRLGGSVGLLVQSPADASVDEIPTGDLKTATAFGERIAAVTKRFS
ncbi:MAG: NAD(P)H-dependent oxidoreductase [Acetobacter sp.]|jgi:multimeric flavodoxin WrbA|nr:NAD(P)H-dependent oxidoreductase [Acetobacter sp.]MCH4060707.1 NAD(P)H-dependent oxidoreductase [Acetobacter sp.]MCH4087647.1 NAD(P)H-dependent oxidoreductase [Acetobacter sp.]MCI1294231.1 NAD(P)H-dependent oxidoreductase [Acetobacter sp.]MCI1320816.1 NAD(P)H-dependent oxidoreductase [Acetobacter sp.]